MCGLYDFAVCHNGSHDVAVVGYNFLRQCVWDSYCLPIMWFYGECFSAIRQDVVAQEVIAYIFHVDGVVRHELCANDGVFGEPHIGGGMKS